VPQCTPRLTTINALKSKIVTRALTSTRLRGLLVFRRHPQDAAPPPATGPAAPAKAEPQPTLRVMRLYKPRLHFSPAAPSSAQADVLRGGAGSADASLGKVLMGRRESDCALSSCLILPDSFGSIHRGETFCA
jgi:hypothetical protein